MLRIAICDDDSVHISYIKRLTEEILKEHSIEITKYLGANELLFKIDGSDYSPDIALLDIQTPDIDGISLAKKLSQITPRRYIKAKDTEKNSVLDRTVQNVYV